MLASILPIRRSRDEAKSALWARVQRDGAGEKREAEVIDLAAARRAREIAEDVAGPTTQRMVAEVMVEEMRRGRRR